MLVSVHYRRAAPVRLLVLLSMPERTKPASCEVRSDINLHSWGSSKACLQQLCLRGANGSCQREQKNRRNKNEETACVRNASTPQTLYPSEGNKYRSFLFILPFGRGVDALASNFEAGHFRMHTFSPNNHTCLIIIVSASLLPKCSTGSATWRITQI